MFDALTAQVQVVARLRQESQLMKDCVDMAMKAWREQHSIIIAELAEKAEQTRQAEEELRRLTIEVYEQTGEKKPVEGVAVRIMTHLVYNPKEALIYAMQHSVALQLDVTSFEKMCKIPELKPGFVVIVEKPIATISQNLESLEFKP